MSEKNAEHLLVQGLQNGDHQARQEFFTQAHDAVFAYACRLSPDYDLRRDWTHDCLLKLSEEISAGKFEYRRPGSLWAWFSKRARFVVLDYYQNLKRQQQRETDFEDFVHPHALENPEQDFQANETVAVVEKCIQNISNDSQQKALRFLLFQDFSYAEIASIMKRPLNTVRGDIRLGRIALRTCVMRMLGCFKKENEK